MKSAHINPFKTVSHRHPRTFQTLLIWALTLGLSAGLLASCGEEKTTDPASRLKVLQAEQARITAEIQKLQQELLRSGSKTADNAAANTKTKLVQALTLEEGPFRTWVEVQGTVDARQSIEVTAESMGVVRNIKVKEGQKVTKGQILAELDQTVLLQSIEEIKGQLDFAKQLYTKQANLWKQNIGSEIQFLQSKNNYESLQQNLETLQAQKALYNITAPFAGIVDEINPKIGEMANPAMPAFRLINTEIMYVKADITERYIGQIKEGDKVMIHFPSADTKVESKIHRIGSFINPNNRSFKIKLLLDNSDKMLKPNMLGELEVRDYKRDSAVVIPTSLIQITPTGEEFVYVIKENGGQKTVVKTMIESGKTYDNNSEVLKGLTGSETIVSRGARSIKDGDVVQT